MGAGTSRPRAVQLSRGLTTEEVKPANAGQGMRGLRRRQNARDSMNQGVAGASALKRFMFSVMAISVGRRSMLEAPKNPTTPVVRSST